MRKLDNNKLDEIGRTLVKADVLLTADLEKLVANPALFDSVRTGIALAARPAIRRPKKMRRLFAAFASVAIIGIVGFAVVMSMLDTAEVAVRQPATPVSEVKRFNEPDKVVDRMMPPTADAPPEIRRTSDRSNISKRPPLRRPEAQQVQSEGEFYALSYAGDPNETERGGRIIRVDIPRSTLFAMGVDIPLENEAETVKADLLVGNDGVTRAIRVVK